MPSGQVTDRHAWETAAEAWVAPGRALELHQTGRWQMIAPTLTTLQTIARYSGVSRMLDDVAAEAHLDELTADLRDQGMHPLR